MSLKSANVLPTLLSKTKLSDFAFMSGGNNAFLDFHHHHRLKKTIFQSYLPLTVGKRKALTWESGLL